MNRKQICNISLIVSIFIMAAMPLAAQQLTRFAVIDLAKVYSAFFRDSRAVRDLEERSARVNAEIARMTAELQALNSQKLDAQATGDEQAVLRLESEIFRKSEYLKEYYRIKSAEIEDQKLKLSQSNAFLQQVMDEVRLVAESEGYSIVLKKDTEGVLWYSPTVDITDIVIQKLMTKAGR